jgi:hypothetical protein
MRARLHTDQLRGGDPMKALLAALVIGAAAAVAFSVVAAHVVAIVI